MLVKKISVFKYKTERLKPYLLIVLWIVHQARKLQYPEAKNIDTEHLHMVTLLVNLRSFPIISSFVIPTFHLYSFQKSPVPLSGLGHLKGLDGGRTEIDKEFANA